MVNNMGKLDRIVRIILASAIIIFYFTGQLSGTAAIALGLVAAIFIVTSLFGSCPLYRLLKISTKQ